MSDQDIRNGFAIGGLIVGFYAGNPALGYLAGSAIGSHIAGPLEGPDGPRMEDLRAASADYGAPLAEVFGAMRVPGHLIWSRPFREHEHKETVGDSLLSSGTTVTTYSYTASFACAVAAGPIVGVRRIWANGQLKYDARSAQAYEALVRRTVNIQFEHDHLQNYSLTLDGIAYTGATLAALVADIEAGRADLNATALSGNRLLLVAQSQGQGFVVSAGSSEDENNNSAPARSIVTELDAQTRDAALVESARFGKYMTVYTGSTSQLPDPTLEAAEGAGNVPAYRDTAYIVFKDLPLGGFGNALPRIEVEVVAAGAADSETVTLYRPDDFGNWTTDPLTGEPVGDPDTTITEYWLTSSALSGEPWTTDKNAILDLLNAGLPASNQARYFVTFAPVDGPAFKTSILDPELREPALLSNYAKIALRYFSQPASGGIETTSACDPRFTTSWQYTRNHQLYRKTPPGSSAVGTPYTCDTLLDTEALSAAGTIYVRIRPKTPQATCTEQNNPCDNDTGQAVMPGTGGDWCVGCDGSLSRNLSWTPTTGTFRQLQALSYFSGDQTLITRRDLGPVLPLGHPDYDSADFWNAAAAAAGIDGTYGVDYPVTVSATNQASYVDDWLDAAPESLSVVVDRICAQAGLQPGEWDSSGLAGSVVGYAVTRPMAARSALEPLALAYEFDAVERDGALVFVHRGGAVAASLGAAELGAGAEGESQPSLEITRTEDDELPRSVAVVYADTLRDYQPQTQRASRQQAGGQDIRLSLPLALTDDAAATLVERQLWRAWAEREAIRTAVLRQHARLEPGDVLNLDDGHTQREARLLRTRHLGGRLALECVTQDRTVFAINRPGQAGQGSRATIPLAGPTSLLWVDSTLASDADDAPGAYVALTGIGDGWGGAALYRSLDAGKSWQAAATTNARAPLGRCRSVPAARDGTLLWRGDSLDVVMAASADYTPPSVTEADVLNGANRAIIGRPGRWELMAWQTAQQVDSVTWRLSGLLRGLRGTEWATGEHQLDDWFLPVSGLTRVNAEASSIGAERLLRAVTFGHDLTEAADNTVTLAAEGLKPYSPARVRGNRASNGTLRIDWVPRTRTGGDWLDNADAPLGESINAWEIDILNSSGAVLRTLSGSAISTAQLPYVAFYSNTDQVTDFGATQAAITVRIYQLSALVGRGHPAEATL